MYIIILTTHSDFEVQMNDEVTINVQLKSHDTQYFATHFILEVHWQNDKLGYLNISD